MMIAPENHPKEEVILNAESKPSKYCGTIITNQTPMKKPAIQAKGILPLRM